MSEKELVRVRFARKARNVIDVRRAIANETGGVRVAIAWTKQLSSLDYDEFCETLLHDRVWLYIPDSIETLSVRHVIAVCAPDRPTLYVDPSGYYYARYVGLRCD